MYPPESFWHGFPAAAAYSVTPPPLAGTEDEGRGNRTPIARQTPTSKLPARRFMPSGGRHTNLLNRNGLQVWKGNRDPGHPRRGSACHVLLYAIGRGSQLLSSKPSS